MPKQQLFVRQDWSGPGACTIAMVNPGDGNFTGTVVNSSLKTKKVKAPPYGNFYLFIYNNTIKQLFFQICPDHPSRFFLFLDHIFQEICRTGIIGILFFLELFDVLTDFTN